jgi:hypothetical protein
VRALVVLVAFVASSCSSPAGPTSTTPSVAGRVLDFQAGTSVAGATVVFADPSNASIIAELGRSVADSAGQYQMSVPVGRYSIFVDGVSGGLAIVRAGANRTDLLVHANGCVARYGTLADSRTGRPVAGATVSLLGVTDTSKADGSYRLDFGCQGRWSNTIFMTVARSGYGDEAVPMGRGEGFADVRRQDVDLAPR